MESHNNPVILIPQDISMQYTVPAYYYSYNAKSIKVNGACIHSFNVTLYNKNKI